MPRWVSGHSRGRRPGTLTERALPQPSGTLVGEQAQQVAYDAVRWEPLGRPTLQVGEHDFEHLPSGGRWSSVTVPEHIGFGEEIGMIIGHSAQHRTINELEMGGGLQEGSDAAIDLNAQRGEVGLETIDVVVAQWWYGTVFPWTQAMENGLAGVDDETVAADLGHGRDKMGHIFVAIQVINADTVLHGDRQRGGLSHGLNAPRH